MSETRKTPGQLFDELTAIIAKLRNPAGGCPWDLEQTHQSLKPYIIEEAYEVLDAIDLAPEKLAEELGDVLLQVMLHSQIGKDDGTFDISQVVQGLSAKLIERHPHVFGDKTVSGTSDVLRNWEAIKKQKRAEGEGMLDSIPRELPALLKAQRIGAKVARVGFDWETPQDICTKIEEELDEFITSSREVPANPESVQEEFGDLLFTVVQLARKLGLDAEETLRQANLKFMRRFGSLEKLAGCDLKTLERSKLEELWQSVKKGE